MKSGPHPGMRAAAEMKKQAAQTQGPGGKGMMSVVLPMYAVGIVIYLIYTMTKVFGRKDKKNDGRDYLSTHFSDLQNRSNRKGDVDSEDEEPIQPRHQSKKKRRDLERLLLKADRDKISEIEVAELKRRLLETEEQMTRILQAMESVSKQVDSTVSEAVEEEEETVAPNKNEVDSDTVFVKTPASSPDTDSYEFLQAKTPDSEQTDFPEVENIGSNGDEESSDAAEDSSSNEYDSEVMEEDKEAKQAIGGDFEPPKAKAEVRQRVPKKKAQRID